MDLMFRGHTGASQDGSTGPGWWDLGGNGPALAELGSFLDTMVFQFTAWSDRPRRDSLAGALLPGPNAGTVALQILTYIGRRSTILVYLNICTSQAGKHGHAAKTTTELLVRRGLVFGPYRRSSRARN